MFQNLEQAGEKKLADLQRELTTLQGELDEAKSQGTFEMFALTFNRFWKTKLLDVFNYLV